VTSFVKELGHDPIPGNEAVAFSVDLDIVDPTTGQFGIGIECDSPRHAILARARARAQARELWRPSILAGTMRRLHRVSREIE
jgi:hypothetical protein